MSESEQINFREFVRTHSRTDSTTTSTIAAKLAESTAAKHCKTIRQVLLNHGPLTAEQIAERCELDKHQVGRRMSDLRTLRWADRDGTTRMLKTGRPAHVYRAVQ